MATYFVTGAAGFIGINFVRQVLQDSQNRVVAIDKLTYASQYEALITLPAGDRLVFAKCDIADTVVVNDLLHAHSPEFVVNLAAESHVDRSIADATPFLTSNVLGAAALLDAVCQYWRDLGPNAKERFRFLQVSTDEVFGSLSQDDSAQETWPYKPNSPYAASKAAADHFVRAYHRTFGLPTLITHSSNNFGPYQHPEKLVPKMILNALEGLSLPVYGNGLQQRDWIFVADHCRAILAVLERGTVGESYNISANIVRTNLDLVAAICRQVDTLLGRSVGHSGTLISHVADRPGHDQRYSLDARKIRRELGWGSVAHFDSALRETVSWYVGSRWAAA